MRIVHIEDWFHPEMGYQINFYARYHNPEMEFIIVAADNLGLWGNPISSDELMEKDRIFENKYNVKIVRLPAKHSRQGKHNVWLSGLPKQIESLNPDVVFVHAMETLTALRLFINIRLRNKYKYISDTHTLYNQFGKGIKNTIMMKLIKFFVVRIINKKNIKVFYTALENRQILLKLYGVKPELVKNGSIGTDTSIYRYDKNKATEIRRQLGIDETTTVLLYTGKFNYTKQPHLIFEAVRIIEEKIKKPLHLLMIGSKNQDYFKEYCSDIKINNELITVQFIPHIKNTELYGYYSMADFAVFPKENTLSSLDAQVCQLPLVMEDDETNKERLKKGGILYRKNDLNDLADKILYFINNPEALETMGKEGSEYVSKVYDYQGIIKGVEKEIMVNHS